MAAAEVMAFCASGTRSASGWLTTQPSATASMITVPQWDELDVDVRLKLIASSWLLNQARALPGNGPFSKPTRGCVTTKPLEIPNATPKRSRRISKSCDNEDEQSGIPSDIPKDSAQTGEAAKQKCPLSSDSGSSQPPTPEDGRRPGERRSGSLFDDPAMEASVDFSSQKGFIQCGKNKKNRKMQTFNLNTPIKKDDGRGGGSDEGSNNGGNGGDTNGDSGKSGGGAGDDGNDGKDNKGNKGDKDGKDDKQNTDGATNGNQDDDWAASATVGKKKKKGKNQIETTLEESPADSAKVDGYQDIKLDDTAPSLDPTSGNTTGNTKTGALGSWALWNWSGSKVADRPQDTEDKKSPVVEENPWSVDTPKSKKEAEAALEEKPEMKEDNFDFGFKTVNDKRDRKSKKKSQTSFSRGDLEPEKPAEPKDASRGDQYMATDDQLGAWGTTTSKKKTKEGAIEEFDESEPPAPEVPAKEGESWGAVWRMSMKQKGGPEEAKEPESEPEEDNKEEDGFRDAISTPKKKKGKNAIVDPSPEPEKKQEDDWLRGDATTKSKAKKGKGVEEMRRLKPMSDPNPEPEPEPEKRGEVAMPLKKSKKKQKGAVDPEPAPEPPPPPPPEPEPEPTPPSAVESEKKEEDIWSFGTAKKEKKKKKKDTLDAEPVSLKDPASKLEPEPEPDSKKKKEGRKEVDDDTWDTFGTAKKDKKKKGATEEVPKDPEREPESAPVHEPELERKDPELDDKDLEPQPKRTERAVEKPNHSWRPGPQSIAEKSTSIWSFWGVKKKLSEAAAVVSSEIIHLDKAKEREPPAKVPPAVPEAPGAGNLDIWGTFEASKKDKKTKRSVDGNLIPDSIEEPKAGNIWGSSGSARDKKGNKNAPVEIENGSQLNGVKPDAVEESKADDDDAWGWGVSKKGDKSKMGAFPPPAPTPPSLGLSDHESEQELEHNVWDESPQDKGRAAAEEAAAAEAQATLQADVSKEENEIADLEAKRARRGYLLKKEQKKWDELMENANRRAAEKAARDAEAKAAQEAAEQAQREAEERAATEAAEAEAMAADEAAETGSQVATEVDSAVAAEEEELATLERKKEERGKLGRKAQRRFDELTENANRRRKERAADEVGITKDIIKEAEEQAAAEAVETGSQAAAEVDAAVAAEEGELAALEVKKEETGRLDKKERRRFDELAENANRRKKERAIDKVDTADEAEEQATAEATVKEAAEAEAQTTLDAAIAAEEEELATLETRKQRRGGRLAKTDQKRFDLLIANANRRREEQAAEAEANAAAKAAEAAEAEAQAAEAEAQAAKEAQAALDAAIAAEEEELATLETRKQRRGGRLAKTDQKRLDLLIANANRRKEEQVAEAEAKAAAKAAEAAEAEAQAAEAEAQAAEAEAQAAKEAQAALDAVIAAEEEELATLEAKKQRRFVRLTTNEQRRLDELIKNANRRKEEQAADADDVAKEAEEQAAREAEEQATREIEEQAAREAEERAAREAEERAIQEAEEQAERERKEAEAARKKSKKSSKSEEKRSKSSSKDKGNSSSKHKEKAKEKATAEVDEKVDEEITEQMDEKPDEKPDKNVGAKDLDLLDLEDELDQLAPEEVQQLDDILSAPRAVPKKDKDPFSFWGAKKSFWPEPVSIFKPHVSDTPEIRSAGSSKDPEDITAQEDVPSPSAAVRERAMKKKATKTSGKLKMFESFESAKEETEAEDDFVDAPPAVPPPPPPPPIVPHSKEEKKKAKKKARRLLLDPGPERVVEPEPEPAPEPRPGEASAESKRSKASDIPGSFPGDEDGDEVIEIVDEAVQKKSKKSKKHSSKSKGVTPPPPPVPPPPPPPASTVPPEHAPKEPPEEPPEGLSEEEPAVPPSAPRPPAVPDAPPPPPEIRSSRKERAKISRDGASPWVVYSTMQHEKEKYSKPLNSGWEDRRRFGRDIEEKTHSKDSSSDKAEKRERVAATAKLRMSRLFESTPPLSRSMPTPDKQHNPRKSGSSRRHSVEMTGGLTSPPPEAMPSMSSKAAQVLGVDDSHKRRRSKPRPVEEYDNIPMAETANLASSPEKTFRRRPKFQTDDHVMFDAPDVAPTPVKRPESSGKKGLAGLFGGLMSSSRTEKRPEPRRRHTYHAPEDEGRPDKKVKSSRGYREQENDYTTDGDREARRAARRARRAEEKAAEEERLAKEARREKRKRREEEAEARKQEEREARRAERRSMRPRGTELRDAETKEAERAERRRLRRLEKEAAAAAAAEEAAAEARRAARVDRRRSRHVDASEDDEERRRRREARRAEKEASRRRSAQVDDYVHPRESSRHVDDERRGKRQAWPHSGTSSWVKELSDAGPPEEEGFITDPPPPTTDDEARRAARRARRRAKYGEDYVEFEDGPRRSRAKYSEDHGDLDHDPRRSRPKYSEDYGELDDNQRRRRARREERERRNDRDRDRRGGSDGSGEKHHREPVFPDTTTPRSSWWRKLTGS
ncbi:hypothetical protein DL763_005490 [Monosporascus cannonballus]|nr:hypothetical protein DL763_005490 [Monosporascus cannonballus]